MEKKYRSMTLPIKASKPIIDYFFQCNKETARVWNECVRLSKELWKTKQEYSDRKYLQDRIKGAFSDILPAQAMHVTIKKYLGAVSGIQQARKAGRTDEKYPWRIKKNYNTIWCSQMIKVDYEKNIIRFQRPMSFNLIIKGKKKSNPIFLKFKTKLPPNIAYAEITYDNGLKLALNYRDNTEYLQIESNNVSAIDLGEIHSITSMDNMGNDLIITGRQMRSYQRFRNKELGKLEKRLSKCTKGSRNYKKYRSTIRKLMSKSNRKINNDIHKTAKIFTDYAVINNIKTVVVGDLKNFNMNLKKRKQYKGTQQKLVQWQHGKLVFKLKEKLNRYGVNVEEISEAYTSQTCPNCGDKHKPKSRNYVCNECGFTMHRDVVGAYNILSKYINDGVIKKLDIEVKPIKYLRID